MDQVARIAAKHGLNVKVVEISDYAVPNQELDAGHLEANSFQNQPYLDDQVKNRGYKIMTIAKTILVPMRIYSKKVKHVADLRNGAVIAVPNDPTNEARALKLLQTAKLIKLRGNSFTAGVADITENPKQLQIRELNAAQTPRSLDDIDAACINGNYAATAGLTPNHDAIVAEGGSVGEALRSPYSNIIAVRDTDSNAPWARELVTIYHSSAIRGYILRQFGGTIFPAF
jgi:D-methionine transport system substrate-binding protein